MKIDKLTKKELLEQINQSNPESKIFKHLVNLSRNEPFLVYDDGGKVNIEHSLKLLEEIIVGFTGREFYELNGKLVKVYKLGENDDKLVDENPLFVGKPLRPDGTCDQTNRNYNSISKETRQFLRLLINNKEVDLVVSTIHDILDVAIQHDGLEQLRKRYPQTALKFDELQKLGQLPSLTMKLISAAAKVTNIFNQGKKVVV